MSTNTEEPGLVGIIYDIINAIVEFYLARVIKPFLTLHEKFYNALNKAIRSTLDNNSEVIPKWFTANFITYVRTVTVVPCLLLMVSGHTVIPSIIVLLVDFGDFLDGVVARYWVDIKKNDDLEDLVTEADADSKDKPETVASWTVEHRNKTYGGFIDAVCDKAFVVPCWISLLSNVSASKYLNKIQFIVLWTLILTETASACIRFRAYYTSTGVAAPTVVGLDVSTSAVKADHIGKAKQSFEMVGTALFILPFCRYLGLLFLAAASPLAYESVRRKIKKRVIYISYGTESLDHTTLKFWKQAKGLGSKLVVGITSKDKDLIANACASECVDAVVSGSPAKLSMAFLKKEKIDYVVLSTGQSLDCVGSDVSAAKRCLVIGKDDCAKLVESKEAKLEKEE